MARRGAVKARTAALNQLTACSSPPPTTLRDQLAGLTQPPRWSAAAPTLAVDDDRSTDPLHATKAALRALARASQALDAEIAQADKRTRPARRPRPRPA